MLALVVGIKKFLKPLNELEVVLKPSLHESINRYDLIDVHLLEGGLENLEILDVLVLKVRLEFHLLQQH